GHDRAHEVLVGPHASGDAVHDDPDLVLRHDALLSDCLQIRIGDVAQELRLIAGPARAREDLHLVPAIEAGVLDPGPDLPDGDAALAGEAAILEQIGGGGAPVAHVKGGQPAVAAGPLDLLL